MVWFAHSTQLMEFCIQLLIPVANIAATLESEYATEYRSTAKKIIEKFSDVSECTILNQISKKSVELLRNKQE